MRRLRYVDVLGASVYAIRPCDGCPSSKSFHRVVLHPGEVVLVLGDAVCPDCGRSMNVPDDTAMPKRVHVLVRAGVIGRMFAGDLRITRDVAARTHV